MRASMRIAPVIVMTALIVAGCGDDRPAPPASAASSAGAVSTVPTDVIAEPARPLPDKAVVATALLTPEEVGPGFSANPAMAANNPAAGLNTSVLGCANVAESTSTADAAQVYQGGPIGPFVVETITVTPQAGAAATLMGQLRTVKQNCHQFDGEMAGGIKLQVTIDDLTIRKAGDDTVAYRMTGTVPGAGAAIYAHLVMVRAGRSVIMVSLMQMTSPDVSVTETIVHAAAARAQQKLP